ncbi:MAG: hypothetical protein WCP74_03875 [Sphingobacteriia bacterium]|jgi:hypothetical protein
MSTVNQKMRIYHRYLGFFLAGIMAIYSLSGIVLIFRDTNTFKVTIQNQKKLAVNLSTEELGKEIKIKELKSTSETEQVINFKQGTYNKITGDVSYTTNELPTVLKKLTNLHKADTKDPLYYLNIFFGCSLFFFVISSFWMFLPNTTIFKKGLYFTLAGIVLALVMLFI